MTIAGGQFLLRADVVEFRRGDILAGRYQIEKAIGRGATGTVVQAFDRVVRGVVAVKVLRPDLSADERWVERLGGELRYARKLQHPNVCRVFDMGDADGHHFLTMEFAGGGSLRQRMAEAPDRLRTWDQRIADARAVIEGLVAIHAANIVHRDVKPENVLVMDDGRLVVSDFGLAVSAGQTTYFSSKVAGTPSYMAPEVIMGEKATPRADVFSLGIVLHEILFCRRPDWQMTPKGRIMKTPVGRKSSTRERAFASICTECLREYAPDRLADAATVKARFEQAVEGRLRPLRGRLRQKWPLLVGLAAIGASVAVVMLGRGAMKPASTEPATAKLVGKASDLGAVSRPIFTSDQNLRCFDILPGRKAARFVLGKPATVVDVDLATGAETRPKLVPEAYQAGCPQLSPDGKRLLYAKDDDSKRSQIMLSPHPDGSEAVPLTEGNSPSWLPSGEEFVYSFDNRRAASFTLPKTRMLFPDSPPFEKVLQQIAVNDEGDKVAFLFLDSRRQVSIEVYGYPSLVLTQRASLDRIVGGVQFDGQRRTLQLSVPDPANMALVELTPANELSRVGEVKGTNVLGGFRTTAGMALVSRTFSYAFVLRDREGRERTFGDSLTGRADVSQTQDFIFDKRTDDGRLVVAYQRANDALPRFLTTGPNDLYPSFSADGRSFVYVRVGDGAIVSCAIGESGADNCRTVFVDGGTPRFALASPDGRQVAYQTTLGLASRLRIVSIDTGKMRDLGIYRSACPPLWSSSSALWIQQRGTSEWREIDATTAQPTGVTEKAGGDGAPACDQAPRPRDHRAGDITLRRFENRSTQLRIAAGL